MQVTTTYNLPFTPQNFVTGPDRATLKSDARARRQWRRYFATDGLSSSNQANPNLGAKIVSFNLHGCG